VLRLDLQRRRFVWCITEARRSLAQCPCDPELIDRWVMPATWSRGARWAKSLARALRLLLDSADGATYFSHVRLERGTGGYRPANSAAGVRIFGVTKQAPEQYFW